MRTILILFVLPAALGIPAGLVVRHLSRKRGWSRGWLFFAAALCYATLDTGAVWYASIGSASDGWADLGALVTGAMLLSFSLAGLAAAGVRRVSLAPWAPPGSPLRGALRGVLGYGLGTLLLSPVILLLGSRVGFAAAPGQPGLPLFAYVLLLAVAYPLLGLLLGRWLSGGGASLWGLLLWVVFLAALGLLAAQSGGGHNPAWWPLYSRVNFPAAVCLGEYRAVLPASGVGMTLSLSAAPPLLFGLGWAASRLLRRDRA